ncbi:MAG: acyltransferase [Nitrospirae bacterium]|nr:acyltransferase [Nitrospirota bacterium]
MYKILSLIFGESYWSLHSMLVKVILLRKGVKVGEKFRIKGTPHLKIRGRASDICIGNNVFIGGDIDIRNREHGKIVINDDVAIDSDCRFVAANDAELIIGKGTAIGPYCTFNCGTSVIIGQKCLFAGNINLNSSEHNIVKSKFIRDQGYSHAPIVIEDDVWISGNVTIKMGVVIKKGAVVGANAVVTKDVPEYAICVGVPAKVIKYRE